MVVGRLSYNHENGRYGLIKGGLWEHYGFHCGETFEVDVNGEWVWTRMEIHVTGVWFLVGTPYYSELENIIARISK